VWHVGLRSHAGTSRRFSCSRFRWLLFLKPGLLVARLVVGHCSGLSSSLRLTPCGVWRWVFFLHFRCVSMACCGWHAALLAVCSCSSVLPLCAFRLLCVALRLTFGADVLPHVRRILWLAAYVVLLEVQLWSAVSRPWWTKLCSRLR
jgi:hypothetical protein